MVALSSWVWQADNNSASMKTPRWTILFMIEKYNRTASIRRTGRHRVVAGRAPRMAFGKAFEGQPPSLPCTPLLERFKRIMGACRLVPAVAAQQGTQDDLVNAHQRLEHLLQNGRRSSAMTNDNAMAPPHTKTCWSRAETPKERTKLATANNTATRTNWPASTPRLNGTTRR